MALQYSPSLALDLIEEFRPVIVDHLVIRLCTTGKVSPAGFTTSDDGPGGCRMDPDTLRVFLGGYENRMLTVAHHPGAGRRDYDIADDERCTAVSDLLPDTAPASNTASSK